MDYIPVCNPKFAWDVDEKEIVTVHVVNAGICNRIAQKILKKPQISHVKLDEYGSFVWQQLDGKRTIYEISNQVGEKFGKDAEPLINRLVKYFQILYDNKFIGYVKKK